MENAVDTLIPPKLIICNDKRLIKLNYDISARAYGQYAEMSLSPLIDDVLSHFIKFASVSHVIKIGSLAEYTYLCSQTTVDFTAKSYGSVIQFDSNLKYIRARTFKSIGDLVIDNHRLFLAADGDLIVLDHNLEDLGRIRLEIDEPSLPAKNAHSILIFAETAYLLDNIVMPMFLLEVSLKNLKEMAIRRRIETSGVNAHLSHQWLDPRLQKWFVIESYNHMGGQGQNLMVFSLFHGDKPSINQSIWSDKTLFHSGADRIEEGLELICTTELPPILTVVRDSSNEYFLSRIKLSNQGVEFEGLQAFKELSQLRRGEVGAKFIGNHLFVIAKGSLNVITLQTTPRAAIATVDLVSYGMDPTNRTDSMRILPVMDEQENSV